MYKYNLILSKLYLITCGIVIYSFCLNEYDGWSYFTLIMNNHDFHFCESSGWLQSVQYISTNNDKINRLIYGIWLKFGPWLISVYWSVFVVSCKDNEFKLPKDASTQEKTWTQDVVHSFAASAQQLTTTGLYLKNREIS